ncbi:hypothetical protein EXIGLDRAFT_719031 [Exidia glandulosa HHB12029]|uniref:Uncharacterized protein n=1 Tax=Exidia glandulosa HHB12029 TaxID=1314781 RepID=A0A165NVQ3_EXIGL|nr:hypothetical protein EXIGLDRAFT_719031 [Exidia glandulosa HHB12029]
MSAGIAQPEAAAVHQTEQAGATGPTATDVQDTNGNGKVGFKEQVLAEAKIIRGTLLGRPEEKDFGKKILNQEVPAEKEVITTRGAAPTQ